MKLKSLLKVLDPYSYVEIDDEEGATILCDNGRDEPIEVKELPDIAEQYGYDLSDCIVVRVYYDFGRFIIETKLAD